MRRIDLFSTVRTEGGLLPADLLQRITNPASGLKGIHPESYHLAKEERLTEAISRGWNRALGAWAGFRASANALPETDRGTSITRERWLLILFQELGYGRLLPSRAVEIDGKPYPISHFWQNVPIHLIGFRVDLDRRTSGVPGAARTSPHGLVQEFLNRSEKHLWGFVSNGLRLRILRDNLTLTRLSYVEFDLQGMMEGEVYSDFALLYLLCHESRVEAEKPEECWLERWTQEAQALGTRALEHLRQGVEQAVQALGSGFVAHPANKELREKLRSRELDTQDYYRQLLRLVYRLLFLFVAEDRGLLLDPEAALLASERYTRFYSTRRLRTLAERRRGTRHPDLYRSLRIVMEKVADDKGCPELALPPLGSFLWSSEAIRDLLDCDIANNDFLRAVRALAFTDDRRILRAVDYKNLGTEELGSVYESLLELHPEINADAATFNLETTHGHERKTTGSYYTPRSLIQCLLDSALDPVLKEAVGKPDPEQAILSLKVCDPACGSGHFLIAAAHRVAKRLAAVRTGDEEPSPQAVRKALRDVIGRSIYGVDLNPMAVELCKVGLWMESLEPGKPLSFLEHRILCGNSLLGTTPALLEKGIPDAAFELLTGDDREVTRALKKKNREERQGQMSMFTEMAADTLAAYGTISDSVADLDAIDDQLIRGIHEKETRYRQIAMSPERQRAKLAADAWCAAFVWRKTKDSPAAITHDLFLRLQNDPNSIPPNVREEIARLAEEFRFFHWHLAFPDVLRLPEPTGKPENPQTGWNGGFDVVLGNPPWERIKIQEKEWFSGRRPDIADAANKAARQRLINSLKDDDPDLYTEYLKDQRSAEGASHLVRSSQRYPLCGRGDINTFAIFAELKRSLISSKGRVGAIVPSGVATDDTTKYFFQDLMDTRSLMSLYDFENRQKLFPAVDSRMKFCLLTLTGCSRPASKGADFVFFAQSTVDLTENERHFALTSEEIALLNPNTRTCPVFRSKRDAELTKSIYRRVPVLIKEGSPKENPWGISFLAMLHMANDSHLFRTRPQLETDGWVLQGNIFRRGDDRYVPLYEAKMLHHFDHRFGDYRDLPPGSKSTQLPDVPVSKLQAPRYAPLPRYWVPEAEVEARLQGRWDRGWLLGWRDITNTTNERTVIAAILPRVGVGDKFLLMLPNQSPEHISWLLANLNSFVFDYVSRQKVGGTSLKYFTMKQLPVLPPSAEGLRTLISGGVLELTYPSYDLQPFAKDCGYNGPPFLWDDERRFLIRCELDAAYFHLYGIERPDVDYIMETFPIVKRKDEKLYGEYRTKRTILEIYDSMAEATKTGKPYQTPLVPPPGPPASALPPWPTGTPRPSSWPPHTHPPKPIKPF